MGEFTPNGYFKDRKGKRVEVFDAAARARAEEAKRDVEKIKNVSAIKEIEITAANVIESGLISGDPDWAGTFIPSDGFVATTALAIDYDNGKPVTVRCTIVGTCGMAFYDKNNAPVLVVSSENCAEYGISPGYAMQEFNVVPPADAKYLRMSASVAEPESTYEGPYSFLVRGQKTSEIWEKVNENEANIKTLSDAMGVKEEQTAISISETDIIDGRFITGATGYEGMAVETPAFVCTGFIHAPLKAGTQAEVRSVLYGDSGFAFYDKTQKPLLVVSGNTAGSYGAENRETMQTVTITVPNKTEYVRLSAYKETYTGSSDFSVVGIVEMSYRKDVESIEKRVRATESRASDAKVLVIGDSISTDYYGNYPKWVTHLIDVGFFDSAKVTNDSIHATGFVARYNGEANDFITRLEAVSNPEAYDLVIVFGGINDYIQNIPMGESGGDKTANFKPAVDYFFQRLVDKFAHARIAVLSPLRTYATNENTAGQQQTAYADYIKTVAKSYCLPVLNLTEESGFCPFVSSFMAKWTLIPDGYTDPDGVHPNEEYERRYLAPMIRHFLQNLL